MPSGGHRTSCALRTTAVPGHRTALALHVAKLARLRQPAKGMPLDSRRTILEMSQLAQRLMAQAADVLVTRDLNAALQMEQDSDRIELRPRPVSARSAWGCSAAPLEAVRAKDQPTARGDRPATGSRRLTRCDRVGRRRGHRRCADGERGRAPMPVIVTEAGGRVTDLEGAPVLRGTMSALVTDGRLHDEFVQLMKDLPRSRDRRGLYPLRFTECADDTPPARRHP
ncbi:hypothetical protein ACFWIJ_07660 [Streptomyces sp. NPDC127079]|uniref:hypothetical protein n=1 Tax=Streptomyces sp. NPDC127079 TaxID=3347132 RepID=UPI003653E792